MDWKQSSDSFLRRDLLCLIIGNAERVPGTVGEGWRGQERGKADREEGPEACESEGHEGYLRVLEMKSAEPGNDSWIPF